MVVPDFVLIPPTDPLPEPASDAVSENEPPLDIMFGGVPAPEIPKKVDLDRMCGLLKIGVNASQFVNPHLVARFTGFQYFVAQMPFTLIGDVIKRRDLFVFDLALARELIQQENFNSVRLKRLVEKYVMRSGIMSRSDEITQQHLTILVETLDDLVNYLMKRIIFSTMKAGREMAAHKEYLFVEVD